MTAQDLTNAGLQQNLSQSSTARKRTRRIHPKVRTGCITCKIRRKKCDETKPNCQRCTSTGRKCDGYSMTDASDAARVDKSIFADDRVAEHWLSQGGMTREVCYTGSPGSGSSLFPITDLDNVEAFISPPAHTITSSSTHSYHKASQRGISEPDTQAISLNRAPSLFSSETIITDLEIHCFSYFRYHTGPQLSSYFASTLWQRYSANIGLSHPVIFACGAALGAVHRRFNLGISAEALRWCAHSDRLVKKARRLLTAFKRDIRSRNHLLDSDHVTLDSGSNIGTSGCGIDDIDVLMTAHMLLFHFEAFQSDFPAAVFDLKVGIKYLLQRPMRLQQSETSYLAPQDDPYILIKFFEKMRLRARELLGSDEGTLELARDNCSSGLPSIPAKFDSQSHARDYIFAEVRSIVDTPDQVWRSAVSRTTARTMHMNRVLRWSAAYAETILGMDKTETEKRIDGLLRVVRSFAYMLLYYALQLTTRIPEHIRDNQNDRIWPDAGVAHTAMGSAPGEYNLPIDFQTNGGELHKNQADQPGTSTLTTSSIWKVVSQREDLRSKFHRLKIWADMLLDPTNPFCHIEHSASFDSGVGPPINPLPSPQSSGKIRFLVKYLSERSGEDRGGTDISGPSGIYGLAEQASAIEEHAVLEAVQSRFPSGVGLEWVDVTMFAEERRILMQYCSTGPDELDWKTRWVKEWWIY